MSNDKGRFESVYSKRVRAGKRRTYFFDVRKTRGDDYYLTLTESTRKFNGDGYERHKIFLYKEDFNRFMTTLEEVINHIKVELMPDYDYDEYTRRHEEWEARRAAGEFDDNYQGNKETTTESSADTTPSDTTPSDTTTETTSEDDISW